MKISKEVINDLIKKNDLTKVISFDEEKQSFKMILKQKTDEQDLLDFIHYYINADENKIIDGLIKLKYKGVLEKIKNTKTNYYVKFIYNYEVDYNKNDRKEKFLRFIKDEILSYGLDYGSIAFNSNLIDSVVEEKYDSFLGKRFSQLEKINERLSKLKYELQSEKYEDIYEDYIETIEQIKDSFMKKYETDKETGIEFNEKLAQMLSDVAKEQYELDNITIFNNQNINSEIDEVLGKVKNNTYTLKNFVTGAYDKERINDREFIRQDSEQILKFLSNYPLYLKPNETLSKERIMNYLLKIKDELNNKKGNVGKAISTRFDNYPYQESAKEIMINNGSSELAVENKLTFSSRKKLEELVRIKEDLKKIVLVISTKLNLTKDEYTRFYLHVFGTMIDKTFMKELSSKKAFNNDNVKDFIVDIIFELNNNNLELKELRYYLALIKPVINEMGLNKLYNIVEVEKEYNERIKGKNYVKTR